MSTTPELIKSFWRSRSQAAASESVQRRALNFDDPLDNLYASGKLWATYDEKPVYNAFHGLMICS